MRNLFSITMSNFTTFRRDFSQYRSTRARFSTLSTLDWAALQRLSETCVAWIAESYEINRRRWRKSPSNQFDFDRIACSCWQFDTHSLIFTHLRTIRRRFLARSNWKSPYTQNCFGCDRGILQLYFYLKISACVLLVRLCVSVPFLFIIFFLLNACRRLMWNVHAFSFEKRSEVDCLKWMSCQCFYINKIDRVRKGARGHICAARTAARTHTRTHERRSAHWQQRQQQTVRVTK